MSKATPSEWTQIDLTSRRGVVGQRITASLLIVAGVLGFLLGFPSLSEFWWELALLAFGCLLIVVLGIGLWINAGVGARATAVLTQTGTRVDLPVIAAFETTDEAVRYQLQLQLPATDGVNGRDYLVHACGDPSCVTAARDAPNAHLPVLIDVTQKTWGVIHRWGPTVERPAQH